MKINRPVTDKEIVMAKDDILVTRTDLKGIITYANDAFVAISGYSRAELIGSSHNIVRHPDMPAAAFEDLWLTLKQGSPWSALVKNRSKSGDYYWVEANVTPVFKNGFVQEYLSSRYAPKREHIEQAEQFYKQLNANTATMRPTGLSALVKSIKEMAIWKKAALLTVTLAGLASLLCYRLFLSQEYLLLTVVAALSITASIINILLFRSFSKAFEDSIGIMYRLAGGKFRNPIELHRQDQIGDFYRGLYAMQVNLNADLAESKQIATNAIRINQALDNVQSGVMVTDPDLKIIYMNKSVQQLFNNAEQDIRKQLPHFNAERLMGANIDMFHKNPAHQRSMLNRLTNSFRSELNIADLHMTVVVNPVINQNQERIGFVAEWVNRTNEVNIENEIKTIIAAVKAGELHNRLNIADKTGFFQTLSTDINNLTEVIEQVFNDVASAMQSMAAGDLTNGISHDYEGIYGSCKDDINASIAKLSEVFMQIKHSAEFINNSSQEIASGNNNLSQRAEEQAASLEQTASSMEELTSTVKNNADNAQQANQVATSAQDLAEKGGSVVNSAVRAMQEINDSSNKIAAIIGVIDEIAFQTNLLALNASVEAARAGEHGRGFSVVATEVRNLAQRSATAARESKELIQNSIQKVRAGTQFVNETGLALTEIVTGVKKVGAIIAEIASASAEQSAGIEQVNQAVAQMDEITQQNAALAEQAAAASVSMSEQTTHMAHLLAFFEMGSSAASSPQKQLPKPAATPAYPASQPTPHAAPAVANNTTGIDLNAAIQKHSDWKVKLRTAIAHQEQLDAETIAKDNCCDFGKWLYGDAKKQLGHLDHYVDCVSKHATFHIEAGKVATAINAKKLAEAEAMLNHNTPYAEASRLVCIAITQLQKELKHSIPTATPSKAKPHLALTDNDEWSDF